MNAIVTPFPKEQATEKASIHVVNKLGCQLAIGREPLLEGAETNSRRWIVPIIGRVVLGEMIISAEDGEVEHCPTKEEIEEIQNKIKAIVSEFTVRPEREEVTT